MTKWKVIVERTVRLRQAVDVEASTVEDATEEAMALVGEAGGSYPSSAMEPISFVVRVKEVRR